MVYCLAKLNMNKYFIYVHMNLFIEAGKEMKIRTEERKDEKENTSDLNV
jgi:hypothetical protein